MAKITSADKKTDIGSRPMANPQVKASIQQAFHDRLEEEAERLGISLQDLVRFALVAALEAPRRIEDTIMLQGRLAAIEKRLKAIEGKRP